MIYLYKCEKCNNIEERVIVTHDITNSKGIIDKDKLEERMYNQYCCGQKMKKLIQPAEWLFFEYPTIGKISRRFK